MDGSGKTGNTAPAEQRDCSTATLGVLATPFGALLCSLMVLMFATLSAGCIGIPAQLMYVIYGPEKVPAQYEGLKNKSVVIVCVSDASAYGPDTLSYSIGEYLGAQLTQNVKGISIVPQRKVETWKDENDWDETDFSVIGKELEVDMVIALDITSYTIHQGVTMYKGRTGYSTTVYDIAKDGEVVFSSGPRIHEFPKNHGRPATEMTERQFEAGYLSKFTEKLAWQFAPHEKMAEVADDATMFD